LTSNYFDWLPQCALNDPIIKVELEAIIAGWSQRWFADDGYVIESIKQQSSNNSLPSNVASWVQFGPSLSLRWEINEQISCAGHALDYSIDTDLLSDDEIQLLANFADHIAADLGECLENLFGSHAKNHVSNSGSNPNKDSGEIELTLRNAKRSSKLIIGIDAQSFVRLRKKLCAPYTPAHVEPILLMEAIGPENVKFRVSLGKTNLAVSDLSHIAPGDFLILDSNINEPIGMIREQSEDALFSLKIDEKDGEKVLICSGT
jgi:flagellar motor switch/type III secretory pathway protein FliN